MNRVEYRNTIKKEASIYGVQTLPEKIKKWFLKDHEFLIYKYIYYLRKTEYYCDKSKILFEIYQRKKNLLGAMLGITIWQNCVDSGLHIWHYGSIVINGHAKVGHNCQLHGENCIGNKGSHDKYAPVIGNNVDIGIGAKIIGNVYIADDVKIGANAVVTKSCYNKGAVLVGIPAKEING